MKTNIISKIFGILFILHGLFTLCAVVTMIAAIAGVEVGESLANQIGENVKGDFSTLFAILGTLATAALSAMYFVSSYALLANKRWAYMALALLAIVGFITSAFSLVTKSYWYGGWGMVWSLIYAAFAFVLYQKRSIQ